jgi:hypothetical protein
MLVRGVVAAVLCAGLGFHPAFTTTILCLIPPCTVTVPDDFPTIQQAIDSGADTVLVNPGAYPENAVVSRPVTLRSRSAGTSEMPELAGLSIRVSRYGTGSTFEFQRIRVTGPVLVVSDNGGCDFRFMECDLQAGLADSSRYMDTTTMSFAKCRLAGFLDLWAKASIRLDSCHVTGHVSARGNAPDLSVRGCLFNGDNVNSALTNERLTRCDIIGNQVRGYAGGLGGGGDYTTIMDNVVEDCWIMGIAAGGILATVQNNVVRRCGLGIVVETDNRATLIGNTVSACIGDGIYITLGDHIELLGNVVWGCGGNGVLIRGPWQVSGKGNTVAGNGGSGLSVEDAYAIEGQVWERNIGYANGGYGVDWLSGDAATFGCNDWFGNKGGDVQGRPPSTADVSVDPQFCGADSGDFRLDSASPLLADSACGQIGALGVGCGVTATLVQRFTAGRVSDGIRVLWEVADGATASAIWVERAEETNDQAWAQPVMERSIEGRAVVELDRSALLDRKYRYRLLARDGGNVTVLDPGILVEAQARLAFGLVEVGPSPGSGPVRIAFSLAHAAVIEIDVYDVQGRRIASPARGEWAAGTQVVEWEGRSRNGQRASTGLYLVRYRYPGGQDLRPVARVR